VNELITFYWPADVCKADLRGDKKWRVAVLRYFNPIGAHISGSIGEDPLGIPNNLCPYLAQVASGRREQLTIFGDQYDTPDGTGVRDYIHVVDLAHGHLAALNSGIFGGAISGENNFDVYNLGTGNGYSVLQMLKALEKASGKTIKYTIGPNREGDIATCYANSDKARNDLGWVAQKTLADCMEDLWRFQSANPLGYPKEAEEAKK
jgi:UDP-glucose 4-epimerase